MPNTSANANANVIVIDHPVIQTKLSELRDFSSDHRKFRALLDEIAMLMVYEVTRDWPTTDKPIQTPLERMVGKVLARRVTLVPILRAGLGMADGVLRLLPDARLGHLGVYRDEKTLEPVSYYQKLPPDIAQFSTAELEARGLYALLRSANVHLRIASQRIGAAGATAAESRLLELRKSSPLLTMERTTWDDSGRVVELGRHVYVPDSYSFEVTVVGR